MAKKNKLFLLPEIYNLLLHHRDECVANDRILRAELIILLAKFGDPILEF